MALRIAIAPTFQIPVGLSVPGRAEPVQVRVTYRWMPPAKARGKRRSEMTVEFEGRVAELRTAAREWRAAVELALRKAGVLRTLEDMSEEQIQALEKQYGCLVKRPAKKEV
jgi:hypothetical protein